MTITYRTNDYTRWGPGQLSDLSAAQIDMNFWTLFSNLTAVQDHASSAEIAYFAVYGNQLYVHFTDHAVLGPYTIPTAQWNVRGAWQPATAYSPMDVVSIPGAGALYVVILQHTSQATFSPGANDGLGHEYYVLLLQQPANAIPIGGSVGQVLTKHSGSDYDTYWVTAPTGGGGMGLDGADGDDGLIGSPGPSGAVGATGPGGPAGASGTPGGASGATGLTGASGATGATGSSGATGASGATGSTGASGTPGGATGATGLTGATGITGASGATGATGSSGATGASGATGSTGASGTPGGASGATGPMGLSGEDGEDGIPGPRGMPGGTGGTGGTGALGASGSPGGATGASGLAGATGAAGAPGPAIPGPDGEDGDVGPPGPAGPPGPPGTTIQTTVQTVTQSGASLAINRSLGEICELSLTASLTAVTVSNWPATGIFGRIILDVANTGAFSITGWPSGTKWGAGLAPTITSGSGKLDRVMLSTTDGGTTIRGDILNQNYS